MSRAILSVVSVVVALGIGASVQAGKPERDKQKELEPAIKEALAGAKQACGCPFAVAVKWDSYKKADDMMRIVDGVTSFTDAMKQACESADDKKAFCAASKGLKGEVVFGPDGKFEQKGKALVCNTNDSSYCGAHQVAPTLLAGKAERDKRKELEPVIKQAVDDAKGACGCALALEVKWGGYKTAADMMRIGDGVASFTDAMKQVCESPEDKQAFCKGSKGLKAEVAFGPDGKFEEKGKTLTCLTNDSSYCGAHQVKPVFDKF